MATSVSGVTSHFPEAENGFTTTTAGSVSSGAATVTLNSVAGYTNGKPVVLVIDPTDPAKKQTFTGIVDTSGVQITSVVWTAGTNQTHALGATVVDYATATHISMISKGIEVSHDQDGTLKAGAVDNAAVVASGILTADRNVPSANIETYRSEATSDFIVTGTGTVAQSAGLVGTFSNITYYMSGVRYTASSIANKTYTASKDTYVDINTSGTVTYVEVANGATAGMTLTASSIRVAKVITNGSAITSVVQLGTDPLGNLIFPSSPTPKMTVIRQDDTTNTPKTKSVILTGWGVITPGVASVAQETVTFGVTFVQRPVVTLVYGGDHASSTSYGSGDVTIKHAVGEVGLVTTTGFKAYVVSRDASNWAAGNTVFYQWMAIGEVV